jgi:hypothetical protein
MVDYSLHMKQSRLWTSQPAKRTKLLDHSAMDLKLPDDVQGKFSAKTSLMILFSMPFLNNGALRQAINIFGIFAGKETV